MKIAVQCGSVGERCGIWTYSSRFIDAMNKIKGVEAFPFVSKIKRGKKFDIINIQYEPGMCPPNLLNGILQKYTEPIVVTVHHTGYLPQFYPMMDGLVFHSKNQIVGEPWDYTIIKHPALVFPEKGKDKMRKKYGIPKDKKVIGTAGFICGTGKKLPRIAEELFKDLKDDEFVYFITSFWKGGDFSNKETIQKIVKKYNIKEDQFKLDTEFVPEEILNEKMQCCDLLFSWNNSTSAGGTSGIAMDMLGARRKVIVKDAPHYYEVSTIKGVEIGRPGEKEFVEDVFKLLRKGNLTEVPDPEPYSWDTLASKYLEYFEEIVGE